MSLFGNAETGKTSLLTRYISGEYTHNYIQTLGVGFREKQINIGTQPVTLALWDIGGEAEFQTMIPLSADGAHVILFCFDLSQPATLAAVKSWYRQVRAINREAHAVLVGAKWDLFMSVDEKQRSETLAMARKYAKTMAAPLVFVSAEKGVNVNRLFKLCIAKVFGLPLPSEQCSDETKPIFEFE
eukprot:EST47684.1 Tem-1-like protein [Spironucleus salmonicida]